MFSKSNSLARFDLFPKIVPVGKEILFTLRAYDVDRLRNAESCTLNIWSINDPIDGLDDQNATFYDVKKEALPAPQYGYTFRLTLPREEEFLVYVVTKKNGKTSQDILPIYALEPDLLCRTPLMGDMHAHSCYSDGEQGPAFIAAHYRQHGYDFLSITDHRRYQPSLMAIHAFEGLDIPFKLYPGEEVHPSGVRTHIVNFGGEKSVNAYALAAKSVESWMDTEPTPEWSAEMEQIMASLTDLPDRVPAYEVAAAMITARIIREGGGLAILAHPHWIWKVRNAPEELTQYLLEHGIMDALELIGGQDWGEQQLQLAFYDHLRKKGFRVPVVGSSDEHTVLTLRRRRVQHFTEERTVVLATENTRDAIISAVKADYSTTVGQYQDEYPRVRGGEYRIQKYVIFLLQNYFPLRDELYISEGRLMHEYAAGTPGAKEKLLRTVADNAYFEDKYFCR